MAGKVDVKKKRVGFHRCRADGFIWSSCLTLKVFQLAKELGVDSKAIVKKCKDEGIPDIETHMSPVKAGLAATVREWFSSGELKTAIESTTHVEAAKIQGAPRKRTSKKAGSRCGDRIRTGFGHRGGGTPGGDRHERR